MLNRHFNFTLKDFSPCLAIFCSLAQNQSVWFDKHHCQIGTKSKFLGDIYELDKKVPLLLQGVQTILIHFPKLIKVSLSYIYRVILRIRDTKKVLLGTWPLLFTWKFGCTKAAHFTVICWLYVIIDLLMTILFLTLIYSYSFNATSSLVESQLEKRRMCKGNNNFHYTTIVFKKF